VTRPRDRNSAKPRVTTWRAEPIPSAISLLGYVRPEQAGGQLAPAGTLEEIERDALHDEPLEQAACYSDHEADRHSARRRI